MKSEKSAQVLAGTIATLEESATQLPSLSDFMKLVEDDNKEISANISLYSVYHKYSKNC